MTPFAEGTTVSPDRTRDEIERLVDKHGATDFQSAYQRRLGRAIIEFEAQGRWIRFTLQFPPPEEFAISPGGVPRSQEGATRAYEAEVRRLWRCLLLCIKGKFEVLEAGIESFEEAFMAETVMPNGCTVAEMALPAIRDAYEIGVAPDRLLTAEPT